MFDRMPNHPYDHEFVTSGALVLWAMNCNQENFDLFDVQRVVWEEILGSAHVNDIPDIFEDEMSVLVRKSIYNAQDAGVIRLLPTPQGAIRPDKWAQVNKSQELQFPEDLKSTIQNAFVQHGLNTIADYKHFRQRLVIRHLASSDSNIARYEIRIRLAIGAKNSVNKIIKSLYPFIYDANSHKYYGCYYLNELGRMLHERLEREYGLESKVKTKVPASSVVNQPALDEEQTLVLVAASKLAKLDPTSFDLCPRILNLILDVPPTGPDTSGTIWDNLAFHQFNHYDSIIQSLNKLDLLRVRSRTDGAKISFREASYYLELSEKGEALAKVLEIPETLRLILKVKFSKLILSFLTKYEEATNEVRRNILSFAYLRDKSWNEKDLKTALGISKCINNRVNSLYPLIVLDETHFGVGNRYKMSPFGREIYQMLFEEENQTQELEKITT